MDQVRLDVALVDQNKFNTREKARFAILKGAITVNNQVITKPGFFIKPSDVIEIIEHETNPFVSKGGLKLKKAIDEFNVDFNGKIVLDIGASTGGFTDCALQYGAKKIFAIDVGSSQLATEIAENRAVKSFEDLDFRNLTLNQLENQLPDIIVSDVSFISLTNIMADFARFSDDNTKLILLIKPQFEAGKEQLGNDGIVKNPKTHEKVIRKIEVSANLNGLAMIKLTNAPIFERKKNIEYLALFEKKRQIQPIYSKMVIENSFAFQKNLKK